jgi:hypothetical protein
VEKGYPDHAFCFYDSSTSKYYNWIGVAAGCANQPPNANSFPTVNPSPRTLSVTSGLNQCNANFDGGGGIGGDSGTKNQCETNGLLNYRNNPTHVVVVKYQNVIIATFDQAPTGMSTPALSKVCGIADFASGTVMANMYVRDEKECTARCVDYISEKRTSAYKCKLDGVVIGSYPANTVPAKATPTITKALSLSMPPYPMAKDTCLKVGVSMKQYGTTTVIAGQGAAFGLYQSYQNMPLGVYMPLTFYSNSACTTPVGVPTLAMGAEEKSYYFKIDSNAVSVDVYATSLDPTVYPAQSNPQDFSN